MEAAPARSYTALGLFGLGESSPFLAKQFRAMIEIYLDTHKTILEVVCKNIYIYNHQAILFLPNLEKVI